MTNKICCKIIINNQKWKVKIIVNNVFKSRKFGQIIIQQIFLCKASSLIVECFICPKIMVNDIGFEKLLIILV